MRRVWSKFPTDSTKWQNPVPQQEKPVGKKQTHQPNQELASYVRSLLVVEGQSLGWGLPGVRPVGPVVSGHISVALI